jgi:hypothetical protein
MTPAQALVTLQDLQIVGRRLAELAEQLAPVIAASVKNLEQASARATTQIEAAATKLRDDLAAYRERDGMLSVAKIEEALRFAELGEPATIETISDWARFNKCEPLPGMSRSVWLRWVNTHRAAAKLPEYHLVASHGRREHLPRPDVTA